jgi:hypothetical protein
MSLDEQGLVDLSKLEKKDYGKILLTRNPFPSTAIPSEIALTTADRQEVLRRFTDSLSILFSDNSTSVTVLLGDYGAGKSHMLKLFRVSVNSKLLDGDHPTVAVYAKSPGRSIRDLLLYLIDDLGRDFLTGLAAEQIMQFLSKTDPSKYLTRGAAFSIKEKSQIPEFLLNSQAIDLIRDMEAGFSEVHERDLVRAFLTLPHPELGSVGWRWFVGSSLARTEQQLLGISSGIEDSRSAEEVLNALLRLLHFLGFQGIVLLIDEFEAITLVTGPGRGIYQDALRHLIDSNPQGVVIFIAITPPEWNKLIQNPSALERRLTGSVQDLYPFNKDETKELIEKYLRIARVADFDSKVRALIGRTSTVESTTFPFTKDGIEETYSATKGAVFKVVTLCRLCIDELATSPKNLVDSEFVKMVVQKEGFR